MTAVAALCALAGCVTGPATGAFEPAPVPAAGAAAAVPAPIEVAALDPLNAPPPAPAAGDAMLVPPPDANSSQRVPLNTLSAAPGPSAPTSLLTPPGQTPAAAPPAAMQPAQAAPMQVAQGPQAPMNREFQPAPVTPPAATPSAPAPPAPATVAPAMAPTVQPTAPPVVAAAPAIRLRPPEGTAPAAVSSEDPTVVISSATTRTLQAREFVPASLTPPPTIANPGPGEIPLTATEKNTIQRFEILKRLEEEALITRDEYMKRRSANVGGLLPYTHPPAAEGLGRPVPSAEAIVARIAALRRSFEMRAITPQQHALERTMILNALLPENPTDRADAAPPPKDMIEGAAAAGHLERLREKNLISAEELQTEKDAIEHAVTTGLLPSQETGRPAARRTGTAANRSAPAPAGKAAAAAPQVSPMEREITGPVVHIASYRNEASALKGWEEVIGKNKAILAGVQPIVRRVDLGDQGTFYRLMAGSYASMGDAEAACIKLKEAGQFCRASATGS